MRRLALVVVMLVACKSEESEDLLAGGLATSKPNGSAGGFSAALSADLAKGSNPSPTSGSSTPTPASITAPTPPTPTTPTPTPTTPTPTPTTPTPTPTTPTPTPPTPTPTPTTTAGSGSAAVVVRTHTPAKVSPELAAIQLKMLAKWERDIDEAGTFSRDVDVVSKQQLFVFHYGYDDASAPKDRDAYMKWLADTKKMLPANPAKPLLNRQRGGAWYLEGIDGNGAGVFRYLVAYGDKRLICGGSMYRDTGLGDIRDEVIIQAKSICESISL